EIVTVYLTQNCRAKNKVFDFDFADLAIKGRNSRGNVLTKYPVRRITQKKVGSSTLGGRKIWLDETIGRLNLDKRGKYLGEFDTEDALLVIYKDGAYELTSFELTNRYEMNKIIDVQKFDPETVISAVHYDKKNDSYYVKRFKVETTTTQKKFVFINENPGAKLIIATTDAEPVITY
ncbi:MAG: DNA gyrase/topoisomerase IV subunit A, partial [Bacteroidota bacterium]